VHFDVRKKRSAFWVDYSGKGESSAYAANPYAVLKAEKVAARMRKTETKGQGESKVVPQAVERTATGIETAAAAKVAGNQDDGDAPAGRARPEPGR
jgi:hypothetical protein